MQFADSCQEINLGGRLLSSLKQPSDRSHHCHRATQITPSWITGLWPKCVQRTASSSSPRTIVFANPFLRVRPSSICARMSSPLDPYAPHECKPWAVAFGSTQLHSSRNRAQELSAPVLRYSWMSRNLHLAYVARPWQSTTTDTDDATGYSGIR